MSVFACLSSTLAIIRDATIRAVSEFRLWSGGRAFAPSTTCHGRVCWAIVIPLIGASKPMARSAIHVIVKEVVRQAPDRLRQQGPDFESAAAHIERASAHWLRYTRPAAT